MGVGTTPAATPAAASPAFTTSSGTPPGHEEEPSRRRRSLMTRAWSSSQPIVSTSHFIRARSLLSRLPWLLNTRRIASRVGISSSRGVKSSRASAGWGLAPRPPATNTRKPRSTLPSSPVRVVPITPMSLNMAWPQSVAHPEKLILNLRGRRCDSGLRTKCRYVASAHGVMSSTSYGHAPARWQPWTLRTVSPHASREVSPTVPRSRISSGTRSSSTKWNCTFWRVVMWPQPREYRSAMSAMRSSWSGSSPPQGTFTRTIWLWPPWR